LYFWVVTSILAATGSPTAEAFVDGIWVGVLEPTPTVAASFQLYGDTVALVTPDLTLVGTWKAVPPTMIAEGLAGAAVIEVWRLIDRRGKDVAKASSYPLSRRLTFAAADDGSRLCVEPPGLTGVKMPKPGAAGEPVCFLLRKVEILEAECVSRCVRNNQMRALAADMIVRDCRRACESGPALGNVPR
jgi:hypothetical protein